MTKTAADDSTGVMSIGKIKSLQRALIALGKACVTRPEQGRSLLYSGFELKYAAHPKTVV